ncbi:BTAD domain-containing putative transcriptional regulator [Streptomyces sp. NPDC093707]|uniref:BTAD domain-containing putative transcriptional regulator n=1 Tax=Streptomyces sp. NPDC093707 TaxID=3154984 RepID=UPI00344D374F
MTHPSALRERLAAASTALGVLTVTLAVLVGMPYVLWQAAGIPWPDSVHSWRELGERLSQPVSDTLVIDLLAMAGWVCWAAFTSTVIREISWYAAHLPQLRGDRRAHYDHLAALSAKRSVAALCIGTLVIALLTLWRPSAAGAQQAFQTYEFGHRVAATAPLTPSAVQRAGTRPAVPVATARMNAHGPRLRAEGAEHLEYTVVEGDTLWDIADAHLGDALKWPRIYALNKDRVQHDGARLHDPDLLRPGWRLAIPLSGRHPTATTAHPTSAIPTPTPTPTPKSKPKSKPKAAPTAPPAVATPAQPTPHRPPAAVHQVGGRHPGPAAREAEERVGRTAKGSSGPAAIGIGEASLIGITVAAGLLAARRYWYVHQRRQRDPQSAAPALSPLVDKAAQAAQAAARSRSPEDADALITRRTPPQQPRAADAVTIGVSDDVEVSVDILATAGGCAWAGPGADDAARALLTGILTAAERQRPAPAHIQAVVTADLAERLLPGLPPHFTALAQTPDTGAAVRVVEQHLVAHARAQHDRDARPPTPEASGGVDESGPGFLILAVAPDAAHVGQVQAVAARCRPGLLAVLSLDASLPGAEHWHIAADGTAARSSARARHPERLELFRLTPDAGRDMVDVLLGAHGRRPLPRVVPPQQAPSREVQSPPASAEESDPAPGIAAGPPPASASRAEQPRPVRLRVLGPVTLYVHGQDEPVGTNLRPEVHEFLALLAAHPTGLLASDIADRLHLEPGTEQNALKNLRRAVRRALRFATGNTVQEFILRQGELHKLHPELIETDLADFTRLLKKAFSETEKSADDTLAIVREAMSRYRGPFAQGADHLWADSIREHLITQATDAALRLAHQAEHTSADPQHRDAVLTLLEHLGTLHPDHERLAQHAIRLYQGAGRHDAARHAYARLERRLAELGLEPDPATRALVTSPASGRRMG